MVVVEVILFTSPSFLITFSFSNFSTFLFTGISRVISVFLIAVGEGILLTSVLMEEEVFVST